MRKLNKIIVIILLVLGIAYFIPLSYYITEPGTIEQLSVDNDPKSFVKVENGYSVDGSYSLVTIFMKSGVNIYDLIYAGFVDYAHVYKQKEITGDLTNEEYKAEQMENMMMAKYAAVVTAFNKADMPFTVEYDGVVVRKVTKGGPAASASLKAADRITKVDGQSLDEEGKLSAIFEEKAVGDTVELEIVRDEKVFTKQLTLTEIPATGKPGIGIHFTENKNVITAPKVNINSEKISGPSAGLMFALEIFDQLHEKSYAKGHQIAGTGAIDSEGKVGAVGGVDQKVVTAHKEGCDIFFVPAGENYEKAAKTGEKIGTKMKIVPVKTFDDAILYLEELQ